MEGGSKRLSGWQLMEVWDRLCNMLRALGVSVEDVSNKAHSRPSCAEPMSPGLSTPHMCACILADILVAM